MHYWFGPCFSPALRARTERACIVIVSTMKVAPASRRDQIFLRRMHMTVVDTDSNTSDRIPFLRNKGVTAVGRYYSRKAWKRLTRQEAHALSDAGIEIFTEKFDLSAMQGRLSSWKQSRYM